MKHLLFLVTGFIYTSIFFVYFGLDNMMAPPDPESTSKIEIIFYGSILVYILLFIVDFGKRNGIKYGMQALVLILTFSAYEIDKANQADFYHGVPWAAFTIAGVCLIFIIILVIKWGKEIKQEHKKTETMV